MTIVYDPRYPDKLFNMNSIQVALFSPKYYQRLNGKGKNWEFLVIVSHHGVKWPTRT